MNENESVYIHSIYIYWKFWWKSLSLSLSFNSLRIFWFWEKIFWPQKNKKPKSKLLRIRWRVPRRWHFFCFWLVVIDGGELLYSKCMHLIKYRVGVYTRVCIFHDDRRKRKLWHTHGYIRSKKKNHSVKTRQKERNLPAITHLKPLSASQANQNRYDENPQYLKNQKEEKKEEAAKIAPDWDSRKVTALWPRYRASTGVVSILLDFGAKFESVDSAGNDSLMWHPCSRPKNMRWLIKEPDLIEKNTVVGGCALGNAVYFGANKLRQWSFVGCRCFLDYRTFGGGSVLTTLMASEDSDPSVLSLIFETLKSLHNPEDCRASMNYRRTPSTFKWKSIYFIESATTRTNVKVSFDEAPSFEAGTSDWILCHERVTSRLWRFFSRTVRIRSSRMTGMNAFDICEKAGPNFECK